MGMLRNPFCDLYHDACRKIKRAAFRYESRPFSFYFFNVFFFFAGITFRIVCIRSFKLIRSMNTVRTEHQICQPGIEKIMKTLSATKIRVSTVMRKTLKFMGINRLVSITRVINMIK